MLIIISQLQILCQVTRRDIQENFLINLFKEQITEDISHKMEQCPCCNGSAIKETLQIKEKDKLTIKSWEKGHIYLEYVYKKCGKKSHEQIPNNLKEENQYYLQVQALELTLMNQTNVTIKITYGLTNGKIA